MKSNEERRSKLSQICTMKTAYHQKYKTQTKKEERQTKVKVFPKVMSKDYTIYTKCKQTKAKKLKMSNRLKILLEKQVILIKSNIDIRYLG